uniref:Uncharacterized protein n=1 Tax=Glossina pallidipes TaxID=7398 RepID=A0A1A9Z9W8_GLOPL
MKTTQVCTFLLRSAPLRHSQQQILGPTPSNYTSILMGERHVASQHYMRWKTSQGGLRSWDRGIAEKKGTFLGESHHVTMLCLFCVWLLLLPMSCCLLLSSSSSSSSSSSLSSSSSTPPSSSSSSLSSSPSL